MTPGSDRVLDRLLARATRPAVRPRSTAWSLAAPRADAEPLAAPPSDSPAVGGGAASAPRLAAAPAQRDRPPTAEVAARTGEAVTTLVVAPPAPLPRRTETGPGHVEPPSGAHPRAAATPPAPAAEPPPPGAPRPARAPDAGEPIEVEPGRQGAPASAAPALVAGRLLAAPRSQPIDAAAEASSARRLETSASPSPRPAASARPADTNDRDVVRASGLGAAAAVELSPSRAQVRLATPAIAAERRRPERDGPEHRVVEPAGAPSPLPAVPVVQPEVEVRIDQIHVITPASAAPAIDHFASLAGLRRGASLHGSGAG